MSEKSLIRTWNKTAATFVEEKTNGDVVVAVGGDRKEIGKAEWDALPSHQEEAPDDINKAKPDSHEARI